MCEEKGFSLAAIRVSSVVSFAAEMALVSMTSVKLFFETIGNLCIIAGYTCVLIVLLAFVLRMCLMLTFTVLDFFL